MNNFLIFLVFFLLYLLLIWKAGKVFPILFLFIFAYFVQYIFSTFLIYNVYDELMFYMEIGQTQYFNYAIPAYLAVISGVLLFNKDIDIRGSIKRINPEEAAKLGYLLLGISYFFDFVQVPGLSSFTKYMKYSGAFCLLFSSSPLSIALIALVYLQLMIQALTSSVFIDFFVLSTYLFFFISLKYELSFKLRLCFILLAAPVLILVQTVKTEYRKATWEGNRQTGVELFSELADKNIAANAHKPFFESKGIVRTVGRLTQGWHLGLTLKWVPQHESFADGAEIWSDITSSLLPRALFRNKKVVGSQDKFYQYTGHPLHNSTSMTIGVLGDFYINFGRVGSFVALFIFGALIARGLYSFIKKYVITDPINIIWIPFFLNYLMRANNDFYMVFNCIVKGFVIFLFVTYLRKRFFKSKPKTISYSGLNNPIGHR